jgi:uncharacterized protein (DUF2147 family)
MHVAALLTLPLLLLADFAPRLVQASPAGTWHTISDVDGKPRGIIILAVTDGVLTGTIGGSLVPGEPPDKRCTACSGALKDRPLKGMRILDGLRWDGHAWTGGTVLDPDTGKSYRATIRVAEDGRSLTLRGYVGISLLGRTQRWVRAP